MTTRRKNEKLSKEDDSQIKGVFRVRHSENSFVHSQELNTQESKSTHVANKLFSDRRQYDMIFWIAIGLSQIIGFTIIALVVYWCNLYGGFAWSSNSTLQFFYHPLLMVLGLVFFYGDAILIYRALHFLPKWILKCIHGSLQLSAIVMSSVGLVAVFENHRREDRADMYSLHSWVGIATFSFFCLQYVGSFMAFVFPGLSPTVRAQMMPFHTFFGVGVFILAVATCEMGLTEKLIFTPNYTDGANEVQGIVGNTIGLFLIIFAFLVVFVTTRPKYKRKALPSDVLASSN